MMVVIRIGGNCGLVCSLGFTGSGGNCGSGSLSGSHSSPGHFGSLQYSVSIDLVDSGGNFGVDSSLGFTGSGGNCGSGSLSGMKGLHRSAVLVLVLLYFGFPLRNNADLMTLAWP